MQVFSPPPRGEPSEESEAPWSDTRRILERIEAQLVVGAWCVGAAAGLLRGLHDAERGNALLWAIIGLLLVALGGAVGCFCGYVLRVLVGRLRTMEAEEAGKGAELVPSLALGSGVGSFLAALIAVLGGHWATVPWAAALGACLLSAVFTLSGDFVRVLMHMLALDSRAASSRAARKNKKNWP